MGVIGVILLVLVMFIVLVIVVAQINREIAVTTWNERRVNAPTFIDVSDEVMVRVIRMFLPPAFYNGKTILALPIVMSLSSMPNRNVEVPINMEVLDNGNRRLKLIGDVEVGINPASDSFKRMAFQQYSAANDQGQLLNEIVDRKGDNLRSALRTIASGFDFQEIINGDSAFFGAVETEMAGMLVDDGLVLVNVSFPGREDLSGNADRRASVAQQELDAELSARRTVAIQIQEEAERDQQLAVLKKQIALQEAQVELSKQQALANAQHVRAVLGEQTDGQTVLQYMLIMKALDVAGGGGLSGLHLNLIGTPDNLIGAVQQVLGQVGSNRSSSDG